MKSKDIKKIKKCDNTSSGTIFEEANSILLIERKNYPQAIALPAGHFDGDSSGKNSVRESSEEVCLIPEKLKSVWAGTVDNPCKREGGTFHNWVVFKAVSWKGKLKAGDDAKRAFWISFVDLKKFAVRTEYFMKKYNIPYSEVGRLTKAIFGDIPAEKKTDPEWTIEMGLEPVWYKILKDLGKI
jgi:ADP-ribose pyrophosphatase YjhB (NUDIX family)